MMRTDYFTQSINKNQRGLHLSILLAITSCCVVAAFYPQAAVGAAALSSQTDGNPRAGALSSGEAIEAKGAFDGLPNEYYDAYGLGTPAMPVPTFEGDLEEFSKTEIVRNGLGPVFNGSSCVSCHQNPVVGGSSQTVEMRAGHMEFRDPNDPKLGLQFVQHPGGSIIHLQSIGFTFRTHLDEPTQVEPSIQEHAAKEDTIRTLRMSTNILGDGYIECIGDADLIGNRETQYETSFGDMHGLVMVVLSTQDLTHAVQRVGRFGWKSQLASLLDFSADAYVNEMGITSPLQKKENFSETIDVTDLDGKRNADDTHAEPNDDDGEKHEFPFGEDTQKFARFMRSTKVPPRDLAAGAAADREAGEKLFNDKFVRPDGTIVKTGCAICHTPTWTTLPTGTPLPGDFPEGKIPAALGSKIIHPYSDFLLHDVGTGDGIVQQQQAAFPASSDANVEILTLEANGIVPNATVEKWRSIVRTRVVGEEKAPDRKGNGADKLEGAIFKNYSITLKSTPKKEKALTQALYGDLLETAYKIRTAPLWGLRTRPQLLHDGSAHTVEEAILRHSAQARLVKLNYELTLTAEEKRQLLVFLSSL